LKSVNDTNDVFAELIEPTLRLYCDPNPQVWHCASGALRSLISGAMEQPSAVCEQVSTTVLAVARASNAVLRARFISLLGTIARAWTVQLRDREAQFIELVLDGLSDPDLSVQESAIGVVHLIIHFRGGEWIDVAVRQLAAIAAALPEDGDPLGVVRSARALFSLCAITTAPMENEVPSPYTKVCLDLAVRILQSGFIPAAATVAPGISLLAHRGVLVGEFATVGALMVDACLDAWNSLDSETMGEAIVRILRAIVDIGSDLGLGGLGPRFPVLLENVTGAFKLTTSWALGETTRLEDLVIPMSGLFILVASKDAAFAASVVPLLFDCLNSASTKIRSFALNLAVQLLRADVVCDPSGLLDTVIGFVRSEVLRLATDAAVCLGELAFRTGRVVNGTVTARAGEILDAFEERLATSEKRSRAALSLRDAVAFAVTQYLSAMGVDAPLDRGMRLLAACLPLHDNRFFDQVSRCIGGLWRHFVQDEESARTYVRMAAPMIAVAAGAMLQSSSLIGCACGLREALHYFQNQGEVIADALGHNEYHQQCFHLVYEQQIQTWDSLAAMADEQVAAIAEEIG
jgi:hypothetical protein